MDLKTLRETDENVVILPGAKVNGNVTFGPGCSVWYNAVIRGDNESVTLGKNCNVQDNSVFHPGRGYPIVVGDNVTVGHGAIVHGCTIGSGTLIGMGAIVLSGAVIGSNCIVGAGALVTGKMNAPDGSMILGSPAKVVRPLTQEEIDGVREANGYYAQLRESYR
ncbi:MAG: gamma carbonic anhydrase family protein [Candidatus Enterenecus sp.]